jgi:spore maturation protein CgeB
MKATIEELLRDDGLRQQIASNGLDTVRSRHTCRHRAEQLMEICGELSR